MACANNIGLNEITELGSSFQNRLGDNNISEHFYQMEGQSRQSRIPKFGFGFKKILSSGNGADKSSPSSKSSSFVSRSKSMRVQRTQPPPIKINHSNSTEEDETIDKTNTTTVLLNADPIKKQVGSKSNPNSRCNSPHGVRESSGSFCTGITDSTSSNDSTRVQVSSKTEEVTATSRVRGHIRSNSYGSKDKFLVNRGSTTSATRRATVNSRPAFNKEKSPQLVKKAITSTNLRKPPKQASHDQMDGSGQSSLSSISESRRNNENGIDHRRGSGSSQGGRGRRPFSFHEGSPDLNQLASELSQSEESSGIVEMTHRSTRIVKQVASQPKLSSKLRPPMKRNTSDENNRPSSAAANYKQTETSGVSRPRSAADVHKINSTSSTTSSYSTQHQTSRGSRSSTPSSGRSTPLIKKSGIIEEEQVGIIVDASQTKYYKPPGTQIKHSLRMGKAPVIRTPTDQSSLKEPNDGTVHTVDDDSVGLNELKGAVLVDAEDYRKMVQEVKTLKTMLLRLKRELAADGTTPPTTTPPTSMKSSVARLKRGSGANNTELLNKIQTLTSERDKSLQDIEQARKNQKVQETQLEQLKQELMTEKKQNEAFSKKIHELESHREYLMDKMERLHADKHKVEDRLNSLEKSAFYERTILEEVWPEDDLYDDEESVDNGLSYDDEDATY